MHRNPVAYFRSRGATIGNDVEIIGAHLHALGSEPYLVTIGNRVTISNGVEFITHDGGLRVVRDRFPGAYYYAPIVIHDDAFIGAHALLLPGVTVGGGSVVGAGSVVTRSVPDGVVVAGVPARPVSTVAEYAERRRGQWIDTANLDRQSKAELLRATLLKPTP